MRAVFKRKLSGIIGNTLMRLSVLLLYLVFLCVGPVHTATTRGEKDDSGRKAWKRTKKTKKKTEERGERFLTVSHFALHAHEG